MCGILGIAFQNGCELTNNTLARYLIRELLQESELRGRDASGVAFTTKDQISVFKSPMSGGDLIKTREFNEHNRKYMNLREFDGTISVIGHCRAKTKGTPRNNNNNHPIVTHNIVGVHNGEIDNDDELFGRFMDIDNRFYRRAQVDSEIIFRLIDYFSNIQGVHTVGAIRQMSKLVRGSYVCAMVEKKHPFLLWLFRKLGPIVVYHYQEVGVIVFASGENYIMNAVSGMGLDDALGEPNTITVPKYSGVCINLFSNSMRRFKLCDDTEELVEDRHINGYAT